MIWVYSSPVMPVESSDTKNKKYYLTGRGRRLQPMYDVCTCMGTPKVRLHINTVYVYVKIKCLHVNIYI